MIEFKIQNGTDRERVVLGLANSGYSVKVVTKKDSWSFKEDYYVEVDFVDDKPKPVELMKNFINQ